MAGRRRYEDGHDRGNQLFVMKAFERQLDLNARPEPDLARDDFTVLDVDGASPWAYVEVKARGKKQRRLLSINHYPDLWASKKKCEALIARRKAANGVGFPIFSWRLAEGVFLIDAREVVANFGEAVWRGRDDRGDGQLDYEWVYLVPTWALLPLSGLDRNQRDW